MTIEKTILVDDFEKQMPGDFLIWGAGGGGDATFRFLEKIGYAKYVTNFVDSDIKKQGMMFHGLPIISPIEVKGMQNTPIIIASLYRANVKKEIELLELKNPFYYYPLFQKLFGKDSFFFTLEETAVLYDKNDKYTRAVLPWIFAYRNDHSLNQIQPFVKINQIFDKNGQGEEHRYFSGEKTTLDRFSELTIVDVGAFDGDTFLDFTARFSNCIKKYYAFEPTDLAYEKLVSVVNNSEKDFGSKLFKMGLAAETKRVKFVDDEGVLSRIDKEGSAEIDIVKLDEIELAVVGKLCIKMDIEGAELDALKGAAKTIQKYKPELAICIYHKLEDVYAIPNYIKELVPEYRCIIRGDNHTVLYATIVSEEAVN